MHAIDAFEALRSPAAERNKEPIRAAMTPLLPRSGSLLELASGALQHALHIAPGLPQLQWQCSEVDERVLDLAPGYQHALGARWPANVLAPIRVDVATTPWELPRYDVLYVANLLHISPMAVTGALFEQAAQHLKPGGLLLIYGPFKQRGAFTSSGDAQFDENLKDRNPQWGIRSLETLAQRAAAARLSAQAPIPMPANNWLLGFRTP